MNKYKSYDECNNKSKNLAVLYERYEELTIAKKALEERLREINIELSDLKSDVYNRYNLWLEYQNE